MLLFLRAQVLKIGCLLLLLVLALAAQAQVPTLLPGKWQVREISFVVTGALTDSARDHLDDPQIADLNHAIFSGEAQLEVEFRMDGTYQFTIIRAGQLVRTENGTYTVDHNQLLAHSPASADGSSFHDQQLTRLTRRTLLLGFPVIPELPGVLEEVEYRRVK